MVGTKWSEKKEHFDWMQKCIACWKICEEFVAWSVENDQYTSTINACRDVTEMCSQCIKFEAQRSPFFNQLCEVCAEVCEKFIADVKKFKSENLLISETVKRCVIFVKACRKVAENTVG